MPLCTAFYRAKVKNLKTKDFIEKIIKNIHNITTRSGSRRDHRKKTDYFAKFTIEKLKSGRISNIYIAFTLKLKAIRTFSIKI